MCIPCLLPCEFSTMPLSAFLHIIWLLSITSNVSLIYIMITVSLIRILIKMCWFWANELAHVFIFEVTVTLHIKHTAYNLLDNEHSHFPWQLLRYMYKDDIGIALAFGIMQGSVIQKIAQKVACIVRFLKSHC